MTFRTVFVGMAVALPMGLAQSAHALEVPSAATWHLTGFEFETIAASGSSSAENFSGSATLVAKVPGSVYTLTYNIDGEVDSYDLTVEGDLLVAESEEDMGAYVDYWRLVLRVVDEDTIIFSDTWTTMTDESHPVLISGDSAGGVLTRNPLPAPTGSWTGDFVEAAIVGSQAESGEEGITNDMEDEVGAATISQEGPGLFVATFSDQDEDDEDLEFTLQSGRLEFTEVDSDPYVLFEDTSWRFQNVLFSDRGYLFQLGGGRLLLINGGSEITRQIWKPTGAATNYINWMDLYVGIWEQEGADEEIGFSEWSESVFTEAELENPLISGPAADPDFDGISNLLEFAFNMDPKSGSDDRMLIPSTGTAGLPAVTVDAPDEPNSEPPVVKIEFLRRKNSDLTYMPQFSSSLESGDWGAPQQQPTVVSIDDEWERVTVTDTPPPTASRRFARVVVGSP